MRMQSTEASCGPTAMVNALSALGLKREIEECEQLCKCSATTGTSTQKLMAALRSIPSLQVSRIYERKADSALYRLNGALNLGRPTIICVDNSGHWVAVVGQLGVGSITTRYLVADSADMDLVLSYDFKDLLKRWGPIYMGVTL
jgi:hypothetical protein